MPLPLFDSDDVTLSEDNPYSLGTIFVFDEGDYLLDRDVPNIVKSPRDQYHTVKKGELLMDISFQYYGTSHWWWLLRDANDLTDGLADYKGLTIVIPDLEKTKILFD